MEAKSSYQLVKIKERTYRIEDGMHVRFFLLWGSERALLIDCGMTIKDAKEIAAELTDLPVSLLLTHADPDHISGIAQFDRFYMHSAEAANFYKQQKAQGDYLPVKDGEILNLGNRPLKIISTPGHTPGSIAVLDVKERMLFSGDPIQDGMIFMFGPQREMHAYQKSLEKVEALSDEFDEIYPFHGSIPVQKELIRKLKQAADQILQGDYLSEEMQFHGMRVQKVKTEAAIFLIDL